MPFIFMFDWLKFSKFLLTPWSFDTCLQTEIRRITLGIGRSQSLDELASSPRQHYSFYAENYDELSKYETRLARRICGGEFLFSS